MNKCFVSILTPIVAAAHVRDGIRINAVCPGPIVTPMLLHQPVDPTGLVGNLLEIVSFPSRSGFQGMVLNLR